MPKYPWTDPQRRNKDTINSWKKILTENDKKSNTRPQPADAPRSIELNCCQQVWMFPPRPQPSDLIPLIATPQLNAHQPSVPAISSSVLRALRQRRLNERLRATAVKTKEQDQTIHKREIAVDEDVSHLLTQSHSEEALVDRVENQEISSSMPVVDLTDLMSAIASLRSKLETVQPEGMRPSDIAKAKAKEFVTVQDGDMTGSQADVMGDTVMEESSDALLSQVMTSQQSVQLWEDLRPLVEAYTSISKQEQSLVIKAVSELGLENLEDGVLNRLCIDEIFVQDNSGQSDQGDYAVEEADEGEQQIGSTRASQLSYQSSLYLLRVLFHQKASQLSSQPSRLFLDALLHAGKAHGRAIIDGVVLPLTRDYHKFSKQTSELVQKVLKEQTSASLTHFLSHVFEPLNRQEGSSTSNSNSAIESIPLVFLSEAHLMTAQAALGLAALPCPLPTRLWSRFVAILGILWEQVAGLVVTCGSLPQESVPDDVAGILKMYSPTSLDQSAGADQQQQIRLANKVLIQLLLTWTMRQGPHCLEVENLQRLREFCASKMDIKQGKALVSRLDMAIKKWSR